MLKSFRVYNGGVKLFFGVESIKNVSNIIGRYRRLLIVTGRSSAEKSGALKDVKTILEENGVEYEIWSKGFPNPTDTLVDELTNVYREGLFEGLIAIGGGSIIDLAKAVRVLVVGGGEVSEYIYGLREVPEHKPFLLAVNLTHGTGSEIDRYAVITISERKEKLGFNAGYPTVSIDDPRYTLTLPRDQTIYTTMDAFAHAVESATSNQSSPYTILLAREAVEKIVYHLPRALENPNSLIDRYWLLYASMIAGISIDHGVTHYGHLLEHILTGYNPDLPHGAGLAIIHSKLIGLIYKYYPETLSYVLKPLDPDLKPRSEDSVKAMEAYRRFLEEIGFKETLAKYGFDKDLLKDIVYAKFDIMVKTRFSNLLPFNMSIDEAYNILVELL